jgi:hypothetical protein
VAPEQLWSFLLVGYPLTVLIEAPILLLALSPHHRPAVRLFAAVWLNACTCPVVILVLPLALDYDRSPARYLAVAETFAPLAECALFWAAFGERSERGRRSMWRDFAAITLANLASFGGGEVLQRLEWFATLLGSA